MGGLSEHSDNQDDKVNPRLLTFDGQAFPATNFNSKGEAFEHSLEAGKGHRPSTGLKQSDFIEKSDVESAYELLRNDHNEM